MSMELIIADPAVLSESERTELDAHIDALIAAHKDNRQEINRLVFESVAAMTTGEDYERQLASKKGLRRFLGSITGSNKGLQDKINSNRAAAQYASQQTLQRLAEQNLMSFDLITAVNNKLNASVTAIEGEINQIYSALLTFFKQSKSDMVKLESRVERLERNVNLLNWQNAIEYQMFDGVEYVELDDAAKIVCLVRDFYDITKGDWTTSDLLLLKTAMSSIDLPPRGEINYYGFIKRITYDRQLASYLLNGRQVQKLPEPYLVPLLGMQKLELLDGEEGFIVDAIAETLIENHVLAERTNLKEELTRKYLRQEAQVEVEILVNHYDLVMEMLFNLQAADHSGILDSDETMDIPQITKEEKLEQDFQCAAAMFKNCELQEVHPLLVELSEQGFARANALLYWLLSDGYKGCPPNAAEANKYATKGYQAGDVICTLQYAIFCGVPQEERIRLCAQYKPQLEKLEESGDVFAAYMMGICYLNETDEDTDYFEALNHFIVATSYNFYRAFLGIALRYYRGEDVEKDLDTAWLWTNRAMAFSQYANAFNLAGDIRIEEDSECGGVLLEQAYKEAYKYYKHAADLGNRTGCKNLGVLYEEGWGVPQSDNEAFKWYKIAAELGDAQGQYYLATMYVNGKGVSCNRYIAKEWLEKSAAQGHQEAINELEHFW